MKIRKILFSLSYLLYPTLLVYLSSYFMMFRDTNIIVLVVINIITIFGIVLFFKFKPCSLITLLIGALISPLPIRIWGYIAITASINFFTWVYLVVYFHIYSFLYIIISVTTYAIIKKRKNDTSA